MLIPSKSFSRKNLATRLLLCTGIALLALPAATAKAQFPNLFGPPPAAAASGPQAVEFDFTTPVVTSQSEAPGVWYTDRFPPCGFVSPVTAPDGTKNTLEESICTSSFQSPAPSFFNTQGRKYDLAANTYSLSITLYVPAAWATTPERLAGFWATGENSAGVAGNDYPVGIHDDRLPPAELFDTRGDLVDSGLRDLPRIPRVRDQLVDGPEFDFHHCTTTGGGVRFSRGRPSSSSRSASPASSFSIESRMRLTGDNPNSEQNDRMSAQA